MGVNSYRESIVKIKVGFNIILRFVLLFVIANMKSVSRLNGFLNLNKPLDWTSHDCVAKVRGLLKTKKVGHGGTLDPKATGVLPLAIGHCTRLLQYLPTTKAYRAVIRFGVCTDTDDLEGRVISRPGAIDLTLDQIQAALPQFIGSITQVPPVYSAIQVDGRRLYDLARSGVPLEKIPVPSRLVEVKKILVLDWQAGEFPELTVEITCGGGTYIRSIARDLGLAVGSVATLVNLVRTQSCNLLLIDSVDLAAIEIGNFSLQSPLVALAHLPQVQLSGSQVADWYKGKPILRSELLISDNPLVIYQSINNISSLLGIGFSKNSSNGAILCPKVVLEVIE
jgi:tRNA pseudouridine55 synthase